MRWAGGMFIGLEGREGKGREGGVCGYVYICVCG